MRRRPLPCDLADPELARRWTCPRWDGEADGRIRPGQRAARPRVLPLRRDLGPQGFREERVSVLSMALLSLRDIRVASADVAAGRGELQIEPGTGSVSWAGTGREIDTLKVVNGEIAPDEGEIVRQQGSRSPRPQEIPPGLSGTVREIVSGCPAMAAEKAISRWDSLREPVSGPFRGDATPGADRPGACPGLGHPPSRRAHQPLDIDGIAWLETFLLRESRTLLFVTHDRMFLGTWRPGSWSSTAGGSGLGVRLRHVPRAPGGEPCGESAQRARSTRGSRRRRRGSAAA